MTRYVTTRERIPEHVVAGKRLGRNYHYDTRSAGYPFTFDPHKEAVAELWARQIAILNQGDVGSCTGNAEEGAQGTSPLYEALQPSVQLKLGELGALQLYSAAETIDGDGPYPPNDNGSSGTSVCQAAKNAGFISGYLHATTVFAMEAALQNGPVIIGVNWYDSFDSPASNGTIAISPNAQVRGGHEVLVRGVDPVAKILRADNSWGTGWGDHGSMQFSYATMDRLLAEQGDCTVPLPLTAPAPVPAPVPPLPVPVPTDVDAELWRQVYPWARQPRSRTDLALLKADLLSWARAKGYYGG